MNLGLPFLGSSSAVAGPQVSINMSSFVTEKSVTFETNMSQYTTPDVLCYSQSSVAILPDEPAKNVYVASDILETTEIVVDPNITVGSSVVSVDARADLTVVMASYVGAPFIATTLRAEHTSISNFSMPGNIKEGDIVNLSGSAIALSDQQAITLNVPVNSFGRGFIDKVTIASTPTELHYDIPVNVTSYMTSISLPLSFTGTAYDTSKADIKIAGTVNSSNVLLTAQVYDANSIRLEVADIDRNATTGKITIFPNDWTLAFINKPVDPDGNFYTVSSLLMASLEEKYGTALHSKISMIVAKHPETGETFNYVVQDGYVTPAGTTNDFDLCYKKDGAFYPVPFMIKSVTSDTLSLTWEL